MLARQAEVYATDAGELATLEARGDTLVELSIARKDSAGLLDPPYLRREFSTHDTGELRLFMQGGNDSVVVSGNLSRELPAQIRRLEVAGGILPGDGQFHQGI